MYKICVILISCLLLSDCNGLRSMPKKRALIFPPTSPTRTQLIYGIGIPLELETESMTTGYVLKAEYFLPFNASQLHPDKITPQLIHKRNAIMNMTPEEMIDNISGQKYMRYQVEAVEIDKKTNRILDKNFNKNNNNKKKKTNSKNTKNNTDKYRWAIYQVIETIANRMGLVGRACVLRSICEAAETPFHYQSGLLGELMHIIMLPSTSSDPVTSHMDNQYFHAEDLGKSGAPCDIIFKECERSLLEQFSGIYQPSLELLNLFP